MGNTNYTIKLHIKFRESDACYVSSKQNRSSIGHHLTGNLLMYTELKTVLSICSDLIQSSFTKFNLLGAQWDLYTAFSYRNLLIYKRHLKDYYIALHRIWKYLFFFWTEEKESQILPSKCHLWYSANAFCLQEYPLQAAFIILLQYGWDDFHRT